MSEIIFGKVVPQIRFYKSSSGWIAGVCKGLSDSFGFNIFLVRILWLVGVFYYGVGFGIYLILAISFPSKKNITIAYERKLFGVCSKIAQKMRWEIGLVRAGALTLAIASLGLAILAYVVLYFSFEDKE